MTVVLDTGVVLALYDEADPDHRAAADWVLTLDEDLVATPLVVAEVDEVLHRRGGDEARVAFWRDLDAGAFLVRWWADALHETLRLGRRQPGLALTDASLVALAGLLRTNRIATFDPQFRTLTTATGEAFVLLPDDA